jgi:putative transposase
MPVPKKRTIPTPEAAKVASSSVQNMPAEQEFRQRMRTLAVSAMRVLIEEVMREELEQCLCAEWGETPPERKGYRNGSYTRDLVTKTGRIEDLSVPRDREGVFHSQAFERYSR